MKHVLTIAGSDCSGGAGIQADLKTMCAFGVYGMSVISAVTVQNTQAVYDVQEIDPSIVAGQIDAVYNDIRVDAVKIGMVSSVELITTIRERLLHHGAKNIVVDPVMVSKSGYHLLRPEAVQAMSGLIEIAHVVTPNIPEAELLCGGQITTLEGMSAAARNIAAMGAKAVLVKGGHRVGDATDLLWNGDSELRLAGTRIETKNTHGTGCTLSSAIACGLAKGQGTTEAVRQAKAYIQQAIADSFPVGKGVGPVGHLTELYRQAGLKTES